ncbi:MAG: hypothetical protein IPM97_09725 [Bdellovibrionaceae bacterium]|nr:hypothetical protein [Pseudobdellovibrionaceae bacterium]
MSRKNTRKRKIRFKVNYSKMPRCLFTGKLKLRPKIAVSLLIHPGSARRTLRKLFLAYSDLGHRPFEKEFVSEDRPDASAAVLTF